MEKVERVQYQAGLAITGAWQRSNRNVLYENMGWESLSDRRTTRRVLQLYKVRANRTPFYLTEKLPPLRGLLHLNTNPHTFRDIFCKTNRYKDICHFLFECLRFAPHRVNLAISIIEILDKNNKIHNNEIANNPNLYLYGHPSLNIAENKCILQATIQYIKSTHRFSPE